MFVKPEQEIKSTALKRSRYADKVYSEMKNLIGSAYSIVADKRLIQECKPLADEDFCQLTIMARDDISGITHTFPYMSLRSCASVSDSDKILIVIDNMKKREMDSIQKNILQKRKATILSLHT